MSTVERISSATPADVQRVVLHRDTPVVLGGLISSWPALQWTPDHLRQHHGDVRTEFRFGSRTPPLQLSRAAGGGTGLISTVPVQWEASCEYVHSLLLRCRLSFRELSLTDSYISHISTHIYLALQ
jgi:hypothetical protein